MDALASSLERSPELFPHAYDIRNDTVTFVRLTRADYERASFLDGRILGPQTLARTLPWAQLAAATGKLNERCHFIFHIGHVGSTLLSRLLGAHESLFCLREPAILRMLAQMRSEPESQPGVWSAAEFENRQAVFLKLWSRTFVPAQTSVIKTTSFASELAAELLARLAAPKAILLFAAPETYLATILGGANSRHEAKLLTQARLRRLHRRLGREEWRLASLSEGEGLAAGWACEMSALVAATKVAGARALPLDFENFLADPQKHLVSAFRHLESGATPKAVQATLAGPLMQRYSKAPEHAYSPQLRREVLDEARAIHGVEIARGLAWLDRAAGEFPLIRECLEMAGP
jgi:hypothetical protein